MARDPKATRRRALVATLADLLDEETLYRELWTLQDSLRGEGARDIIEAIDALGQRQALDAATCKRLYGELFKALKLPDDQLPLDPWPAMQATRPAGHSNGAALPTGAAGNGLDRPYAAPPLAAYAPIPAPTPAPMPRYIGVPTAAAALDAFPSAAVAMPPPPTADDPDAGAVFAAVMRAVVGEVQRFHREALAEIGNDAIRVLAGSALPPSLREPFARAWERAASHDWRLQGRADDLADLVQVVHRALQMAFGRAGADQILQRAVAAATPLPEARRFSPMRLLAAL